MDKKLKAKVVAACKAGEVKIGKKVISLKEKADGVLYQSADPTEEMPECFCFLGLIAALGGVPLNKLKGENTLSGIGHQSLLLSEKEFEAQCKIECNLPSAFVDVLGDIDLPDLDTAIEGAEDAIVTSNDASDMTFKQFGKWVEKNL